MFPLSCAECRDRAPDTFSGDLVGSAPEGTDGKGVGVGEEQTGQINRIAQIDELNLED